MITFAIIACIVIILIVFAVAVLSVSGAAFIIVFGDFIACGFFIWLIVKLFRRKKR